MDELRFGRITDRKSAELLATHPEPEGHLQEAQRSVARAAPALQVTLTERSAVARFERFRETCN